MTLFFRCVRCYDNAKFYVNRTFIKKHIFRRFFTNFSDGNFEANIYLLINFGEIYKNETYLRIFVNSTDSVQQHT